MSTEPAPVPEEPATPPVPTIHEAVLASGSSGIVEAGAAITFNAAVARRQAGEPAGPQLPLARCGSGSESDRG
jgi:hypothetical protein